MQKREQLYEGKAKRIYATDDPNVIIVSCNTEGKKAQESRSTIEGKRVVLIDDSIVRGTTSRRSVSLLRKAGAKEIHMRVSAPPFIAACYYGTDIDDTEKLIANHHSVEEIAELIGVDSLGYLI